MPRKLKEFENQQEWKNFTTPILYSYINLPELTVLKIIIIIVVIILKKELKN